MMLKTSSKVAFGLILVFFAEYFIYAVTQMPQALVSGRALAGAAVLKYQWLMAFTLAAGLTAPLAASIGSRKNQPGLVLPLWGALLGIAMIGFSVISFIKINAMDRPAGLQASAGPRESAVAEHVKFERGTAQMESPGVMKIELEFRNLTSEEFTELDYLFAALDNGSLFYKIKMRDQLYILPQQTVKTSLTFDRSKFEDPKLFDKFSEAQSRNALGLYALPTRLARPNGTALEDKT